MAKDSTVAILTLISNANGMGPGHTAIVVRGYVYTFEELAGFYGDSWKIIRVKDYLAMNEHRPVLVQELNVKVDARKVLTFIQASIQSDSDYIGSGVCSSQVASAVESGWEHPFNPGGPDTPAGVFALAKNKGIVDRTYFYWPGKGGLDEAVRKRLTARMSEHSGVPAAGPDGILETSTPKPPVPPPAAAPLTGKSRRVMPKESLSLIAKDLYQSVELWPLLWDQNKAKITNPNRITAGMVLQYKALNEFTSEQIAAAKKRSPTWKDYPHP